MDNGNTCNPYTYNAENIGCSYNISFYINTTTIIANYIISAFD